MGQLTSPLDGQRYSLYLKRHSQLVGAYFRRPLADFNFSGQNNAPVSGEFVVMVFYPAKEPTSTSGPQRVPGSKAKHKVHKSVTS